MSDPLRDDGDAKDEILWIGALQSVAHDGVLRRSLVVALRVWRRARGHAFTAGAAAIIVSSDGALLLAKPRYRAGWGLPGGFTDRGEQAIETIRRELAQEIGVSAIAVKQLGTFFHKHQRHVEHIFRLELDRHAPRLAARVEIEALGWFDPKRLPRLQPETHEILDWMRRGGFAADLDGDDS